MTRPAWPRDTLVAAVRQIEVVKRRTGQITLEIIRKNVCEPIEVVRGEAGDMRRDDHVLHVPQGALLRKRLDLKYVESRARNGAGFEGCDQRGLINDRAPGDVVKIGGRLHVREQLRIKQASRLQCVWQRDAGCIAAVGANIRYGYLRAPAALSI